MLIADKLAESTVAALGDQVEVRWVDGPDRPKLLAAVADADALLVRSATTVDAEVIAAAPKLKIVARAGVRAGQRRRRRRHRGRRAGGQRAHVEHPQRRRARAGPDAVGCPADPRRRRDAEGTHLEALVVQRHRIFGKTVGVVGLGRIGQLVAQRLAAFGTHVVAYDPYVPAARAAQLGIELLALDDLLARADFISVHLPKPGNRRADRQGGAGQDQAGVIIVNAARGGLIDESALADAIRSGQVRAAGLDVFSTEPCTDSPLFELEQVVVTPHLGASTTEAQDRAGTDVAASVRLALAGEFVPDAVNVGAGVVSEEVAPWLELVRKLGLLVGALATEPPSSLSVRVCGELASEDVEVLRLSALRGLFSTVTDQQVTFVNAPGLAADAACRPSS